MSEFKVGDAVRIKEEEILGYASAIQSKIRNRVGEVIGHSYPNGYAIINFPACGRKKEFKFGIAHDKRLERVEMTP